MISLLNILRQIISERMSFSDLLSQSDPARIRRGQTDVSPRSLRVKSMDDNEVWTFSYKSSPSTTGMRHRGHIKFLKEDVQRNESAKDLDCIVDCSCPDYKYRWAYNNAKAGAGEVGSGTLNKNNGMPPRTINTDLGEGLCKHLISLGEYLNTNIEPTPPMDPAKETPSVDTMDMQSKVGQAPQDPAQQPSKPSKSSISSKPSHYSDPRAGDLTETKNSLYNKVESFVKSNPEFEVKYV